jgi:transmembrane sensor
MNNMDKQLREREQMAGEAAEWFARQQEGLEGVEQEEFTQWLLRSPAHIEEYLAITRTWGDVELMSDISVDELVAQAQAEDEPRNVVRLDTEDGRRSREVAAQRVVPAKRSFVLTATRLLRAHAAGVVIGAVAMGLLGALLAYRTLNPTHLETTVGEQRSVTLSDGSIVNLNTDSELRIDMDARQRRLQLIRGEARFTVAKDAQRPFIVTTPQTSVRAVGTVFNVQTWSARTAVTVIEGRVAVQKVELAAGQQAAVTQAGEVLANQGPSLERVLAWTERRLVFREEPLGAVVAEFNRYHKRPMRIEDSALAAIKISGTFFAGDTASLLEYLQRYEQVTVETTPNGSVVLRP